MTETPLRRACPTPEEVRDLLELSRHVRANAAAVSSRASAALERAYEILHRSGGVRRASTRVVTRGGEAPGIKR